jgi:hypothetical protein
MSFWRIIVNFLRFFRAAIAVAVVVPSLAFAGAPEVKSGSDFKGISYSMSTSGLVVVYAGVRNVQGKLAICGVVFFEKRATATTRAAEKEVTDTIHFKVSGTTIRVSPRSFKRYMSEDEASAGNAGCSVTTKVWQDAYANAELTMDLSAGTFRY